MSSPLKVDPTQLTTTAGAIKGLADDVRGTGPGPSLSGIGSAMKGLATGDACQQVGSLFQTQSKALGDRYAQYADQLTSAAAAYQRGDTAAAERIAKSSPDGKDAGGKDADGKNPDAPKPEGSYPADYRPVTAEQLQKMVPTLSSQRAQEIIGPLNDAMARGGMNTPQRQAAFISQVAHESDQFATFEEYASGSDYNGRTDLGNTQPGDGEKYKGRGAIQVTGRSNYEQMSKDLGVDFVNHPELAATPQYAFESALWYWDSRNGNAVADTGDITQITQMVNGGQNGIADRTAIYNRALQVLG